MFEASILYILGSFLIHGISYLTTPIFTRLLSPADFGITSVFATWVTFFAVFISLQVSGSIATARVHKPAEEFQGYIKNILTLGALAAIFIMIGCLAFQNQLAVALQMESSMIWNLVLQSYGTSLGAFYVAYQIQIKQPLKQIVFSTIMTSAIVAVSVMLTINLQQNKYWGRIYGATIVYGFVSLYVLLFFCRFKASRPILPDWAYCLKISLPLIVHLLSNIITGQFSRIIVADLLGTAEAGKYFVAHNIGILAMLFIDGCNQAWVPWYFDQTKKGDKLLVNRFVKLYMKLTCCIFGGIALFAPEILKMMAPEAYWGINSTILLIIVSNFFTYLYQFPVSYEQYCQNTKWIAASTLLTAVLSLCFNYWLIPIWGMPGAGLSMLLSYAIRFFLHELTARYVIKNYNIDFSNYIPATIVCFLFFVVSYFLMDIPYARYVLLMALIAYFFKVLFTQVLRRKM